jgi:hypothetical protein
MAIAGVEFDQPIDGLAEKTGDQEGEADLREEGEVGQDEAGAVAPRHSDDSEEDLHLASICTSQ